MKLPSVLASVLTAACSLCVLTANAAMTMDEFLVSLVDNKMQSNAEVDVGGTLTITDTIDLNGHNLTLNGVTAFSGTGTITDSSSGDPSILTIEVAKGKTITNGNSDTIKIGFEGNLQFVKTGEGTLYNGGSKRTHTYTGGTVVKEGYLGTKKTGNDFASFGKPVNVLVESAGEFAGNSCYGFTSDHTITLAGGTWSVGGKNSDTKHAFKPSVSLTTNSTFKVDKGIPVGSAIDLGGYELTINKTISNETCYWYPSTIENGTIKLVQGQLDLIQPVGSSTANLTLGANTAIVGDFAYSVKDFVIDATASIEGPVLVYDTYKPASDDAYMPTMQDGSKLDLSGFEDSFSLDSTKLAGEVTIGLGGRILAQNQQIITWSNGVAPTNTLTFTGTDASFDASKFLVTATGIVFDANTETATSAIWKGTDGDFSNVNNWTFYTATGKEISVDAETFETIKTELAVTIGDNISGLTFDDAFPFASLTLQDATLSADVVWGDAFDVTKITESSNIDLQGHKLTLTVGAVAFKVPITSTVANGSVKIVVPEGVEFDNDGMKLTGALKLIKDGEGTMIASLYPAEFEDGTEILAGTLKCNILNMNTENGKSLFGANNTVTVKGGVLDPAGGYLWGNQTVVMDGGMISNTVANTGLGSSTTAASISDGIKFNPILVLKQDAVLATAQSFNFRGTIQTENDSKLILKPALGTNLLWLPENADNAYVQVVGEGTFLVWGKGPVADENQDGLTFEVTESAKINMNTYSTKTQDYLGGMRVMNYIADSTGANSGAGELRVSGTFTPKSDHFYGATLLSGSKIDLSAKTDTWSTTSAGGETLKFAEEATITIGLGDRPLTKGDWIVSWTAEPNASFIFEGDNVVREVEVVKLDTGLRYGYPEAPHADWVGGVDCDLTNLGNWEGDPSEIKAVFTGDVSGLFVPEGKTFTCGSVWLQDVKLKNDADLSWVDLSKLTDESIIDINGKTITLTASDVETTSAAKFLSSAQGGIVNFVVPAGDVYTNKTISFEGELKFVKQGEGTFVAAKAQDYTGETEVEDGVLVTGIEAINANNAPFGKGYKVVVGENGILDAAGSYGWVGYTIDMNGGTITNTIDRTGYADGKPAANRNMTTSFSPTLNLLQDALIITTNGFNFCGTVLANNHELEINIGYGQYFVWKPMSATNLTLNVSKGGYFCTYKEDMSYANQTNMIFKCNAALNLLSYSGKGSMPVKDYYALYAGATNEGQGSLKVYGTFYPVDEKYFRGCEMQDGSTICLTNKKTVWSTTSKSNKTNGAANTVTFANDATVTIDVHGRSLGGKNKQIVSWTTKPEKVSFIIDADSKAAGYKLVWDDDGIYVEHSGLLLMLK